MNISDGRLKNLNWFPTLLSRLWLNFILGLNLLFQTYYHALPYPKARENKVQSKDKVEPQHFHLYWVASLSRVKFASVKNTLNWSFSGLSAGTGKLCIFGHLGLVFIWSCFVSCLLLLLYYVICAPVLTEGTSFSFNLAVLNYQVIFNRKVISYRE